jgi:hypothetical protein
MIPQICGLFLRTSDLNPKYDDFDMMSTFLLHYPAGASIKV